MDNQMPDAFGGRYRGQRVLVTGHTGFLGIWAVRLLATLGARVAGYSRGHYPAWAPLPHGTEQFEGDVRTTEAVSAALARFRAQIVFHLAGNPSVAASFGAPSDVLSCNAMGTASVLAASLLQPSVRCVVIVSTPAVTPPGDDLSLSPYAASKQAMEAVAAAYSHPVTQQRAGRRAPMEVGVVRPGVMIGGDWGTGRLLADIARAVDKGRPVSLNTPNAARPWQHVLDGLSGALTLGGRLDDGSAPSRRYDFGLDQSAQPQTVREVAEWFVAEYGFPGWPLHWEGDGSGDRLYLGSARATAQLGWSPVWDQRQAVAAAAAWYRMARDQPVALGAFMDDQIHAYLANAVTAWDMAYGPAHAARP